MNEENEELTSQIERVVMLPCPFCGATADIDCDATKDIAWSIDNAQVVCNDCGASTDINWCNPLDKESCDKCVTDVINLWNKRAS